MLNKIFDTYNGTMLVYAGTNNGQIWDFTEYDYDLDAQDFTIEMGERRLTAREIKRMDIGREFLEQF